MADGVAQEVRLLAGRYQVGELLGRGGMADVRAGTDTRLGRRVAIKLLKPVLASDPAFRTRFRREAQDAAKMAHPTIVRIFDAGEETIPGPDGMEAQVPFIIMEYVDGRLLQEIIAEGPVAPSEAVRIIQQVLTALEYSHRAGVVHRDIKPGNIMITSSGQVKVMDFGIARAISESSATIAETSAIVGTAQYFSPEQARGESVDARTDLYSTGVVLFELLTGRPPFRGENPVAVAYQHVNQNPVAPSAVNPVIPPSLDSVVLRALAKDRNARFQTASEFQQGVETAGQGTISAPRQAPVRDFDAALFGVNPEATAGSDATFRQLAVDEDSRLSRTQSRPPVLWIWGGIVFMVAIIAAVLIWTLNLTPAPIAAGLSVSVPDVTELTWEEGEFVLTDEELVADRYSETSDTIPAGLIIRTDPEAGINVGKGQVIKVYVSTGKTAVAIPRLDGLTLEAAQAALAERGFIEGSITMEDSATIRANVVISTTPAGGTSGVEGDVVDLVVSTGLVQVPSVVGSAASQAGSTLTRLLLSVTVVANDGCTGGSVVAQSLSPGAHPQKSNITITVCTG